MSNLPANQQQNKTPSLAERPKHREWIGGRAFTLLSHYWRDDDSEELTAAMGADWADVLEGLPQDAIQKACIHYQRTEPRKKPTPGAIYALARDAMPRPVLVEPQHVDRPEQRKPTKAERDRMAAYVAAAGFKPKRFGGEE